jgi:hypothetical protein
MVYLIGRFVETIGMMLLEIMENRKVSKKHLFEYANKTSDGHYNLALNMVL